MSQLSACRSMGFALAALLLPAAAQAIPITYTYEIASASGTLNSVAFSSEPLVFHATADTDDVGTISGLPVIGLLTASFTINGGEPLVMEQTLGLLVSSGILFLVTDNLKAVIYGGEAEAGPISTYDLVSELSVSGMSVGFFPADDDAGYGALSTTSGPLIFDVIPFTTASFVASTSDAGATVPLPAAAPLFAGGLAMLGLLRRRRRA